MQLVCVDLDLGCHRRRHPRRPVTPGLAFVAGEPEHLRHGFGPNGQLALHLLQTEPTLLRLEHFVAVRACMKFVPPAETGSSCPRSVSRTAPTAASGTGFSARR
jgi:hypothetical protein